ncbi:hypothetical protein ADK41_27775 [Streptomyces caelestis]|uniref:Uncharacterized protein n=2 Tax=Streptomyces TaxID=1883 RepID=A0A0M8QNK1_9ACTN|nr:MULTISPECIES: hypothetical protein [Streptomyces]KOT33658.1 hypothetical protein ADK41_27775 [Streptomyces caelestis]KOV23348.1 hypothetical protein ADK58_24690 [Streptomyces sp. XY152]
MAGNSGTPGGGGVTLALPEGRARVAGGRPSGEEGGPQGALVALGEREPPDRPGAAPTDRDLRDLARIRTDMVGEPGV